MNILRRFLSLAGPLLSAAVTVPLALLAPSAQAFDISFGSDTVVRGSGHMVDENRTVSGFTRVRLESSFDVVLRPGSSPKISVHADDNVVPMIQTVLEGDTLVVRFKPKTSIRMSSDPVVRIEFTQLTAVDVRGSGDLTIEAIKGDTLALNVAGSGNLKLRNAELNKLSTNVAGSGDVTLQGRTQDLDVNVAGSGDVRALDLQSRAAKVSVAGSGDAAVNASDTLSAQIAGSGDVSYAGRPKVTSSVVGSGEVHPVK